MIKTISAALLAVTVLAAPALAATVDTSAKAPTTKSVSAPVAKTVQAPAVQNKQAPVIKAVKVKTSVMNANARMGRHHFRHFRHFRHHHRFHR